MTNLIRTTTTHIGVASLVLAAGMLVTSAVIAAEPVMEEITVHATRPEVSEAGRSTVGAPIELITLEYKVSYADLDLATSLGADALRERVKGTAELACDDLNKKYSLSERDRSCVASTEKDAMASAEAAIKLAQAR